jgi:hypothetical protein
VQTRTSASFLAVAFALLAADNLSKLQASADNAQLKYNGIYSGINDLSNALKKMYENYYKESETSDIYVN